MSDETCGAAFDFFLRVVTRCGRPKDHAGPHHPCQLSGWDYDPKETK